jgi:hypothetical protein
MKTKVGAPAFDDPVARFAVAIPSAIIITALCVVLARCQPAERTVAESTRATTVVLEHAAPTPPPAPPTPRPTSPPTPPPTLPPVPRVTLAPLPKRAAPRAIHASGGGHAAPHPHPQVVAPPLIVAGNGGGVGPGHDSGQGAGAGGGTGNGTAGLVSGGTGGTGSGDVNADAPCGSVDLVPFEAPDHSGSVTYEHVRATVTFPDGHTQSDEFPYHWSYTDPADDPWSAQNLPNPNFTTRVQAPPPGTNVSRYPETIRYILDHTRSDGTTVLQECPRQR